MTSPGRNDCAGSREQQFAEPNSESWSTTMTQVSPAKPTASFVGASWAALFVGTTAFVTGLWNAHLQLNEKGYYLTVLMFGLFAAISVQKSVRDQQEGLPVSSIYFGLSWVAAGAAVVLLTVGLWNAGLAPSEK